MSPAPMKITPIESSAGFGCEVTGVDVNELDDETFKQIEAALYKYKLVIFRDQPNLKPQSQYELCYRFDPLSPGGHGHGTAKEVLERSVGGKKPITAGTPSLPENDNVRVIGYGEFPAGHFGLEEPLKMTGLGHTGFHKVPMSQEQMDKGDTRWHRWHIDAQFHKSFPARVTTLWPHTLPKGPDVTVQFDDGSGQTCVAPVGKTAFFDAAAMYRSLTPEQQEFCKNTIVEYPPHPYSWIVDCRAESNGFALVSEDKEQKFEDLPPYSPEDIQRLPLLWPNPVTGELALQCHAILAYKLHTKNPDGTTTTITDLREIRKILNDLQRPFLKQENILFSTQKEGDLVVWYNRGLRHTAVEYPLAYGQRLAHQCHIIGSDNPATPSPIPGLPIATV